MAQSWRKKQRALPSESSTPIATLAERLSRPAHETEDARRLWQRSGRRNGGRLAERIAQRRRRVSGSLTGEDYARLFAGLLRAQDHAPAYGQHPRVSILGLLEARLVQADVMILGGLNEGSWPPQADIDPWMSRPMKNTFGLPLPERRIGLSAHDFVQLASAPRVFLTRSRRAGNAPTVPSRFLLQLETVLRALGYEY